MPQSVYQDPNFLQGLLPESAADPKPPAAEWADDALRGLYRRLVDTSGAYYALLPDRHVDPSRTEALFSGDEARALFRSAVLDAPQVFPAGPEHLQWEDGVLRVLAQHGKWAQVMAPEGKQSTLGYQRLLAHHLSSSWNDVGIGEQIFPEARTNPAHYRALLLAAPFNPRWFPVADYEAEMGGLAQDLSSNDPAVREWAQRLVADIRRSAPFAFEHNQTTRRTECQNAEVRTYNLESKSLAPPLRPAGADDGAASGFGIDHGSALWGAWSALLPDQDLAAISIGDATKALRKRLARAGALGPFTGTLGHPKQLGDVASIRDVITVRERGFDARAPQSQLAGCLRAYADHNGALMHQEIPELRPTHQVYAGTVAGADALGAILDDMWEKLVALRTALADEFQGHPDALERAWGVRDPGQLYFDYLQLSAHSTPEMMRLAAGPGTNARFDLNDDILFEKLARISGPETVIYLHGCSVGRGREDTPNMVNRLAEATDATVVGATVDGNGYRIDNGDGTHHIHIQSHGRTKTYTA